MKSTLFIFVLLFAKTVYAQVAFQNISFSDALNRSKQEGKLIFLQFEAADCNQCNDVANKGLSDKDISDKINQTFICVRINSGHPDRTMIAARYSLNAGQSFGTLFINSDGTILHKFLRTTSFSKEYLNQMDIALQKAGEALKINELENDYKNGNKSFGLLEVLLQKRKTLNLPTDILLDEYIDIVPADSLRSSINTLSFIAQMAPLLGSKADKAMRADAGLFNRAWYGMSLQTRIGINNYIIFKSMQEAVKKKDENYANRVASFARGTNTNYEAGAKAFDMNMLHFYNETNDTTVYFRKAMAYYERYFMIVSPDSIKRMDSINVRKMAINNPMEKDTVRNGNVMKTTVRVAYSSFVQNFSRELNNGAYEFYKKTNNPYLLSIATEWAVKAIDFYKSPQDLHTYARLLYKQNQNIKAIEVISEAIALQQKLGYPTTEYDSILLKIKNRSPLD